MLKPLNTTVGICRRQRFAMKHMFQESNRFQTADQLPPLGAAMPSAVISVRTALAEQRCLSSSQFLNWTLTWDSTVTAMNPPYIHSKSRWGGRTSKLPSEATVCSWILPHLLLCSLELPVQVEENQCHRNEPSPWGKNPRSWYMALLVIWHFVVILPFCFVFHLVLIC